MGSSVTDCRTRLLACTKRSRYHFLLAPTATATTKCRWCGISTPCASRADGTMTRYTWIRRLLAGAILCACGPDIDDTSPTPEEREEAALIRCEHYVGCGADGNDTTVEECQEYILDSYAQSEDCLEKLYAFDVCIINSTCEGVDELVAVQRGDCLGEYEDVVDLGHTCIPPNSGFTGS